jgi:hypothetical protein
MPATAPSYTPRRLADVLGGGASVEITKPADVPDTPLTRRLRELLVDHVSLANLAAREQQFEDAKYIRDWIRAGKPLDNPRLLELCRRVKEHPRQVSFSAGGLNVDKVADAIRRADRLAGEIRGGADEYEQRRTRFCAIRDELGPIEREWRVTMTSLYGDAPESVRRQMDKLRGDLAALTDEMRPHDSARRELQALRDAYPFFIRPDDE